MRTYYIRAVESDWQNVLNLAALLGVVKQNEDGGYSGPTWVYIGKLTKPTGQFVYDDQAEAMIEQRAVVVKDGEPYIHANLLHPDLRALAEQKAAQSPEIATALQQLSRYFVTDENGEPVAPANPQRVMF